MEKKKKAQLPFRLNVIFLVVFLLFTILIVQLGITQILNGQRYQDDIDRTIKDTTSIPVPRGKIYDREHNIIVDNKPLYSITYTPPKNTQAKEKLQLAEKLSNYISVSSEKKLKRITEREKKEYWYLKNTKKAEGRMTKEELADLSNSEYYNTMLDRITAEEISHFSKEDLEVILLKKELDKGFALTPQIIKNKDVTAEEYAKVAEHLNDLPGINASIDWERTYVKDDILQGILGKITTEEQGIPAEKKDYYLTRGYNRNDRVGKNGLEQQYEDILRGRKEQVQYTADSNNNIIDSEVVVQGERGKDLILSIDLELQERLDEIVKREMRKAVGMHPYLDDTMVVAMNPNSGEILAISGQHFNRKKGKFENAAYKALYDAHRPGSSVKGATVLTGYDTGVISPGQYFHDAPITIKGTPRKASYQTMGTISDLTALERSSNVYMFYIALRIGGEYGNPSGRVAKFNPEGFQTMRNRFASFGLGTETGVDFPFESTGYTGPVKNNPGLLMDLAIGQYDTYTTMQLAQYVSTIANGGSRVRPHFLKEVREPSNVEGEVGPLYQSVNTEVLNKLSMSEGQISRVQQGFYRVYHGSRGTARTTFASKSYDAAGKTGTAQNEIYRDGRKIADTNNSTLVGYAPYNNPEIAFAVVVPNLGKKSHGINTNIGAGLLDAYFDLKKERESGKTPEQHKESEEQTEEN